MPAIGYNPMLRASAPLPPLTARIIPGKPATRTYGCYTLESEYSGKRCASFFSSILSKLTSPWTKAKAFMAKPRYPRTAADTIRQLEQETRRADKGGNNYIGRPLNSWRPLAAKKRSNSARLCNWISRRSAKCIHGSPTLRTVPEADKQLIGYFATEAIKFFGEARDALVKRGTRRISSIETALLAPVGDKLRIAKNDELTKIKTLVETARLAEAEKKNDHFEETYASAFHEEAESLLKGYVQGKGNNKNWTIMTVLWGAHRLAFDTAVDKSGSRDYEGMMEKLRDRIERKLCEVIYPRMASYEGQFFNKRIMESPDSGYVPSPPADVDLPSATMRSLLEPDETDSGFSSPRGPFQNLKLRFFDSEQIAAPTDHGALNQKITMLLTREITRRPLPKAQRNPAATSYISRTFRAV